MCIREKTYKAKKAFDANNQRKKADYLPLGLDDIAGLCRATYAETGQELTRTSSQVFRYGDPLKGEPEHIIVPGLTGAIVDNLFLSENFQPYVSQSGSIRFRSLHDFKKNSGLVTNSLTEGRIVSWCVAHYFATEGEELTENAKHLFRFGIPERGEPFTVEVPDENGRKLHDSLRLGRHGLPKGSDGKGIYKGLGHFKIVQGPCIDELLREKLAELRDSVHRVQKPSP